MVEMHKSFAKVHASCGIKPSTQTTMRGRYYLEEVDDDGKRLYTLAGGEDSLRALQSSTVSWRIDSRYNVGIQSYGLAAEGSLQPVPVVPASPVDSSNIREQVDDTVSKLIQEMIGEDVPSNQPLMELGIDSLEAVELRNNLNESFGVELPATVMFDYSTAELLSEFIYGMMDQSRAQLSEIKTVVSQDGKAIEPKVEMQKEALIFILDCVQLFSGDGSDPSVETLVLQPADAQSKVPYRRWDSLLLNEAHGTWVPNFTSSTKGTYAFDCQKFHMSRQESIYMDPQQRVLLEQVSSILLSVDTNEVGIFAGCCWQEYAEIVKSLSILNSYSVLGNGSSSLVGRVSYQFGLNGPCIVTDTACSSSLVATHLGLQDLRGDSCPSALVAGVNAILLSDTVVQLCQLGALSPSGRCKTFDADADGYGRGEGFAVIHMGGALGESGTGVAILGSAVNQDGRSSSFTAPHGPSQQSLILRALHRGMRTLRTWTMCLCMAREQVLAIPLKLVQLVECCKAVSMPTPILRFCLWVQARHPSGIQRAQQVWPGCCWLLLR